MILVKINPSFYNAEGTAFADSSPFKGMDPKKTSIQIHLGPASFGGVMASYPSVKDAEHTGSLRIDRAGAEISDVFFGEIMNNGGMREKFGSQILELVQRNYIKVFQDGVELTLAAISGFPTA